MGKNIPVLASKSDRSVYLTRSERKRLRRSERKQSVRTSGHRILSEIKCCSEKEPDSSSQTLSRESQSVTSTENSEENTIVKTLPPGEKPPCILPVVEPRPVEDCKKLTVCTTENKSVTVSGKEKVSKIKKPSVKDIASTSKTHFKCNIAGTKKRKNNAEEISKSLVEEDRRSEDSVIIISDAGSDISTDSTEVKIIDICGETEECLDSDFNAVGNEVAHVKSEVLSQLEQCLKTELHTGDETVQVKVVDADGEVEHFLQTEYKVGFRKYHIKRLQYRLFFFNPKIYTVEKERTVIKCVNLLKVPDGKEMEANTEVNTEKRCPSVEEFGSEFCQGPVKIQDEIDKIKEPVIGLAYIVEIWDNNKETVKNYRCFLCKEALKDSAVVNHITRRPHGTLYMKTHFPVLKQTFPCETAPRLWNDSAKAAFDKCCEQIEQVLGRQQLFVTTYGFYLKNLKIIPDVLHNYQVKTINPEGLDETEAVPRDNKENSDWFAIPDKKSTENAQASQQNGDAKTSEITPQKQAAEQTKEQKERGDLYQGKCQIESILKAFRERPILGLNYILEMWDSNLVTVRNYRCFLCDVSLRQSSVLQHVSGHAHNMLFMKNNFPAYAKLPDKPLNKWDQYDLRDFSTRCVRIEKACGRQEMYISTMGYYLANMELVQNKIKNSFKARVPNFARFPKATGNEVKSDDTDSEVMPIIENHGNPTVNSTKCDAPKRNLIQVNTGSHVGEGISYNYTPPEVQFPGRLLPKHMSTFDGGNSVDESVAMLNISKGALQPPPPGVCADDFHAMQRGICPPPPPSLELSIIRRPVTEHPNIIDKRGLYHTAAALQAGHVDAMRMHPDINTHAVVGGAVQKHIAENSLPPQTYRFDRSKEANTSTKNEKSDSVQKRSRWDQSGSSDVPRKSPGASERSKNDRSPQRQSSDSRKNSNSNSHGQSSSTTSSKSTFKHRSRSPSRRNSPTEKISRLLGSKKCTGFESNSHPLRFTSRKHPSRSPIKDRFSEKSRSRSPASRNLTTGARVRSGSIGRTYPQASERRNRSRSVDRRNDSSYGRRNRSRSVDRKHSRSPRRRNRSRSADRNYSRSPSRRNRSRSADRNYSRSPSRRNRSRSIHRNHSRSPVIRNRSKSSHRNRSRSLNRRSHSKSPTRETAKRKSSKLPKGKARSLVLLVDEVESSYVANRIPVRLSSSRSKSRGRTKKKSPHKSPEGKKGLPERYRTIRRSPSSSSKSSQHSSKAHRKSMESKKKCPHKARPSENKGEHPRKRKSSRSSSSSSSRSSSRSSLSSSSSSSSSTRRRVSTEQCKGSSARRRSPSKILDSLPVPTETVQNLTALIQLLAGSQSNPDLEQSLISEQVKEMKEVSQMNMLPSEITRRFDFRDKLPRRDFSDDWENDDCQVPQQTGSHFTRTRQPDQVCFPYASHMSGSSSHPDKLKKFMDSTTSGKKFRSEGRLEDLPSYAEKNASIPTIPAISSEALFDNFRKTVSLLFGSKTNAVPSEVEGKEEERTTVNVVSPKSNSPSDDDFYIGPSTVKPDNQSKHKESKKDEDPPVLPYKWDPDYLNDPESIATECNEGTEGKSKLNNPLALQSILGVSSENKSVIKFPNASVPIRDGIRLLSSNENRKQREVIKKPSRSNTLYHHLAQNSEVYKREWQKFYVSRATELMKAGKKPGNYDFNREWIHYINSCTVEEHFSKAKDDNVLYGSRPVSDYFQISEYEQRQNLHQSYSKTGAHDRFLMEAVSTRSFPSATEVTSLAYHENRISGCALEKASYKPSVEGGGGISSGFHSPSVTTAASTTASNQHVVTIAERLASVLTKLEMSDVPQSVLSEMLAKIGAYSNSLSRDISEFEIISVLNKAGYIN